MKKIFKVLLSAFLCLSLGACSLEEEETIIGGADEPTSIVVTDSSEEQGTKTYTEEDLEKLENTENFLPSTIEHIFLGQINRKGNATGYHYDGIENSPGQIINGTKTEPDENEVYTGQVEVDGVLKSGNKGYSTFYPETLSPQQVIDAINEAYESKEHVRSNTYRGDTSYGFVVEMYLTDDDKIISAFPIYEG